MSIHFDPTHLKHASPDNHEFVMDKGKTSNVACSLCIAEKVIITRITCLVHLETTHTTRFYPQWRIIILLQRVSVEFVNLFYGV